MTFPFLGFFSKSVNYFSRLHLTKFIPCFWVSDETLIMELPHKSSCQGNRVMGIVRSAHLEDISRVSIHKSFQGRCLFLKASAAMLGLRQKYSIFTSFYSPSTQIFLRVTSNCKFPVRFYARTS